jgi:chitosanase
MTDDKIRLTQRILNAFENDSGSPETDYRTVYLYNDGNGKRRQVTLARGFTDDGGNLKRVVDRYIAKGGKLSDYFKTKLGDFGKGKLDDDSEFIRKLKDASSEQAMHEAQDEVFAEAYMKPALIWAEGYGFKETLSQAVIVDTYLHSGSMKDYLMNRFSEKKPAMGGNEKKWIEQYLNVRRNWLATHSNRILRTTVYRPDFFLGQVKRNNWNLDCPLTAHDVEVC